jgi:hypothetical protein
MEMRVKARNREKMSYFGDPATHVFSRVMRLTPQMQNDDDDDDDNDEAEIAETEKMEPR